MKIGTPPEMSAYLGGCLKERYEGRIPRNEGYVYLMWAKGTKFYKIGFSCNPERRLTEVNKASVKMPFEVQLLGCWYTPTMEASEKLLHDMFRTKRAHGEWFALDKQDLEWFNGVYASAVIQSALYSSLLQTLYEQGIDVVDFMNEYPRMQPECLGIQSIGVLEEACWFIRSGDKSGLQEVLGIPVNLNMEVCP